MFQTWAIDGLHMFMLIFLTTWLVCQDGANLSQIFLWERKNQPQSKRFVDLSWKLRKT